MAPDETAGGDAIVGVCVCRIEAARRAVACPPPPLPLSPAIPNPPSPPPPTHPALRMGLLVDGGCDGRVYPKYGLCQVETPSSRARDRPAGGARRAAPNPLRSRAAGTPVVAPGLGVPAALPGDGGAQRATQAGPRGRCASDHSQTDRGSFLPGWLGLAAPAACMRLNNAFQNGSRLLLRCPPRHHAPPRARNTPTALLRFALCVVL